MKIAIVGGGFSGTALSAELIKKAPCKLSITLIEKSDKLGQGTAFSTPCPWHLLNVRAIDMGAFADTPHDFYQWLIDNESKWRALDPSFLSLPFSPNHYMPRMIYGHYLKKVLDDTRKLAHARGHTFETIHDTVMEAADIGQGKFKVIFSSQHTLEADKIVLACGIQATKKLAHFPENSDSILDIWSCNQNKFKEQIARSNVHSIATIIGTGLTMVDMVTTLDRLGFPGTILALSRRGHLPQPQAYEKPPYIDIKEEMIHAQGLLKKFMCFKEQITKYGKESWPSLIDSMRSYTTTLWQQLSPRERKDFIRHLLPLWNIHRHRIPPESDRLLQKLTKEGRLIIHCGSFLSAEKNANRDFDVSYSSVEGGTIQKIRTDFLYNCTGPDYRLNRTTDPLLQSMLRNRWIATDAVDLGISCNGKMQCKGPWKESLFAMGALLYGERFETTAVPDIRTHAHIIASAIIAS